MGLIDYHHNVGKKKGFNKEDQHNTRRREETRRKLHADGILRNVVSKFHGRVCHTLSLSLPAEGDQDVEQPAAVGNCQAPSPFGRAGN